MHDLLGPRQVILVSSQGEIEQFGKDMTKEDIETVFWHMPVSKDELLYAIAVHNNKNIINIIKASGIFVINFIPADMEKKVHQCNLLHGQHLDKFKELGLTKLEASSIEAPYIKEACAHIECHVTETLEYSDYTVFIAKIINSNVAFDVKRLFHIKKDRYTTTKDI